MVFEVVHEMGERVWGNVRRDSGVHVSRRLLRGLVGMEDIKCDIGICLGNLKDILV